MEKSDLLLDLVIEQCGKEKRQKQLNDLAQVSKRCKKSCKIISDRIYDETTTTHDRNIEFNIVYADVDFIKREVTCRTESVTIGLLVNALENIETRLFGEIKGLIKIHGSSESGIDLNDIVKKDIMGDHSLRFSGDIKFNVPRKYCGLNSLKIRSMFCDVTNICTEEEVVWKITNNYQVYRSRYTQYSLHLSPHGKLPINLCKIVHQELAKSTNGIAFINDTSATPFKTLFNVNSNNFKMWLSKNWDTYGYNHHLQLLISDILRNDDWPKDEPLEQWSFLLWNNWVNVDQVVLKAYLFLYEKYTQDTDQPEKWTYLKPYVYCWECHDILDYLNNNECENKRYCDKSECQSAHSRDCKEED
jgi:hypothetical protein